MTAAAAASVAMDGGTIADIGNGGMLMLGSARPSFDAVVVNPVSVITLLRSVVHLKGPSELREPVSFGVSGPRA